jgi:cell shape-determining protein MreC
MSNFSNYDPKIVSIYEIIGAYFTDILFNHIYLMAKNSKSTQYIDEYVKNVKNYVTGLKTNIEYYKKCIQEIHKYFLKNVGRKYMDLKLVDFISRVISISVQQSQFSNLSNSDKEDIFSNIITELIANMGAFVTTPDMVQAIVINHIKNTKTTIRSIQDNAVGFLIEKRALLHNAFVKTIGEVKEHTAVAYTEELKKTLKKAIKEKNEAIDNLDDALNEIESLKKKNSNYKKELEDAKSMESKLRKFIELLNVKNERGIIAAANHIKQPKMDTISENTNSIRHTNKLSILNPENIAEKNNMSNFFAKPISIPVPVKSEQIISSKNSVNILDNVVNSDNVSDNYFDLLN